MNYNKCCRSCLQPISNNVNLLTDSTIRDLFEDCTRLKVNNVDSLPKYLCFICYNKCNKWKEFQEECKENEVFLNNWCFNEKNKLKTEIEFLDLGIKEESESDDGGFDLIQTNNDISDGNESESENVKSSILNTFCEVKIEDNIRKGREIAEKSEDKSIIPEIKPTPIINRRLNPKSILAALKIIVKKNTDLSKLNVCNSSNYTENTQEISEKPISKRAFNFTKKTPDESKPEPENSEHSKPEHSEAEKLNSENALKILTARKSTKRAYCEESDNDDKDDSSDDEFGKQKSYPKIVFKCSLCRQIYKRLEVYELHFLCVHLGKEPIECRICYMKFSRPEKLQTHLRIHHVPLVCTPNHFCTECDKGFENELQLKRHSKVHVIHSCDQCAKIFAARRSLLSHISYAHSNREKVILSCTECEKTFLHKASLDAHVKQDHLMELDYICNVCGKLFATNSKLLTHIRTHSDARPHVCHICSNSYKKKEKLKHHMTIHTGEKPFKCAHCDRSFRHNKVMKHHEMTHTGERPHVCIICDRGFIQKIALRKHMLSHEAIV